MGTQSDTNLPKARKRVKLIIMLPAMACSEALSIVGGFFFFTKVLNEAASVALGVLGATLAISSVPLVRGLNTSLIKMCGDRGILVTTPGNTRRAFRQLGIVLFVSLAMLGGALVGLYMLNHGKYGVATIVFAFVTIVGIPLIVKVRSMNEASRRSIDNKLITDSSRRRLFWITVALVLQIQCGLTFALYGLYSIMYLDSPALGSGIMTIGCGLLAFLLITGDLVEQQLQTTD